ncbi:uncharacterized protein VTP21DRAFT_6971 [Calcarisporiella thermophila]|uniref:uncharacterized protein n=1 Tax=Calcarisporiella thermophila TaxID=911321 RepID=UPI0037447B21
MFGLGKLFHLAADAVLIAACLAGIKRSTGLSLATNKIESRDVRRIIERYLSFGEWVFDVSVAALGQSSYFERRR